MSESCSIGPDHSPALGNLRGASAPTTIYILPGATSRPDWPRIADALMCAVTRGANVIHTTPTERGA